MESFLIRNTFGHKLYELYKLSTNLIERFFGSFNDKMHEAGFGMIEISFFLKKIYLICKKTEIDRIINGKSGERMGYRRFSNRLNKRIKNRKSLRKEDRNYWKNQNVGKIPLKG